MLSPLASWDAELTWRTFEDHGYHTNVYIGQQLQPVEVQKSTDDLDRYQELVEISQPDIVIETGTRAGGSAIFFARLGLQVISIDVQPQFDVPPYRGPGIEWITGSSISPSVINRVVPYLTGKRVMLSLDSDHLSPHVQAEIGIWADFVSPGCFMVVEDACFDLFEGDRGDRGGLGITKFGGPLHAMRTGHLDADHRFWRDEDIEGRTPVSHSPCGWWRKHE